MKPCRAHHSAAEQGFAGPAVPRPWGRWRRRRRRQESTSLVNQRVHFRGLPNLSVALRFPPPSAQTSQRPAAISSGPTRPRPMGTSTCQPDPGVRQNRSSRVAGTAAGASETAEGSLPHQRICSQRWGLGPEKACSPPHRTDPSLQFSTSPPAMATHDCGLAAPPADQHCPGSTRSRCTPGAQPSSEEVGRA